MQPTDLIIGSITYALKAKNALLSNGVRARVRKYHPASEGCTYGVQIRDDDFLLAASVLRAAGIPYEKVQE